MTCAVPAKQSDVVVFFFSPTYFLLGCKILSIGNTTSLLYNKKDGENFDDSLILYFGSSLMLVTYFVNFR